MLWLLRRVINSEKNLSELGESELAQRGGVAPTLAGPNDTHGTRCTGFNRCTVSGIHACRERLGERITTRRAGDVVNIAVVETIPNDAQPIRINRTGPASLEQARKFFVLPETRIGWATLMRRPSKHWLRLDWDPNSVPYFGLWVDEGALNHETVVALEPTTGFYDSLALAWKKGEVTAVAPGSTTSWRLRVRVGTGEHPFAVHNGGRAPVDTGSAQPDAR